MSTEERLEELERELLIAKRRIRWLLVALGVVVVGVALTWSLSYGTLPSTTSYASIDSTMPC
jgi:hypothetical protein